MRNEQNSVEQSDSIAGYRWSVGVRVIVSLLVVVHLFNVACAPLASPQPASQLFGNVASIFQPYIQALYLQHGYRFFAPEPGATHVVRFEIYPTLEESPHEIPDVRGFFPDRRQHWPRQLYHRWFMVSETVFAENSLIPTEAQYKQRNTQVAEQLEALRARNEHRRADLIQQDIAAQDEQIERDRARRDLLLESIGQELLRRHGGMRVKLFIRERQLPDRLDITLGKQLDDQEYFNTRFELYLGSTTRNTEELPQ